MPRRVSLPGADELFRTTGGAALQPSTPGASRREPGESGRPVPTVPAPAGEPDPGGPDGSPASPAADGAAGRSGPAGPAEHSGRGADDGPRPASRVGQ
ncbi:hypothetical protein M1E25_25170, partial [Streptomyces sp. MTZ3.1]|nr:hypothetical protein [Streptomyces meridianus]